MLLPDYIEKLNEAQAQFIRRALEAHDWAFRPTARALGIGPSTLQSKMVTFGLMDEYQERRKTLTAERGSVPPAGPQIWNYAQKRQAALAAERAKKDGVE